MPKATDVSVVGCELYFIPIVARVPLKFGTETMTTVTLARAKVTVERSDGKIASGWGETPLSVQWVWPSALPFTDRLECLKSFTVTLAEAWSDFSGSGHAMELGHTFQNENLHSLLESFNQTRAGEEPMPHLAALVCCSVLDIAVHDAYGIVNEIEIYKTYNSQFMNRDLSAYLEPAHGSSVSFSEKYPENYFVQERPNAMPAWHLVGGKDPIDVSELTGEEPDDGYPVLLRDWILKDGLNCLKIKLRGNDSQWDYDRIVKVGEISQELDVDWLTADFNCTVSDPEYVNEILDRLVLEYPATYGRILYVEQPFPYDLEAHRIDVHSVSARKPLFMDESAHDWKFVKLGRSLGWTGVALKTCKTQTGALLSQAWAKAHGMTLMVQDLTNPALAQVPHVLLAAYSGTIMGVETNAMQFYPEASNPEAVIHPGLHRRRNGSVDLTSLNGSGFGYRLEEISRELPEAVFRS